MTNKVKIILRASKYGNPPVWETEGEVLKITPSGRHKVSFIRPDNGIKRTEVFTKDGMPYPYNYGISKYMMIR